MFSGVLATSCDGGSEGAGGSRRAAKPARRSDPIRGHLTANTWTLWLPSESAVRTRS